MLSRHFFCSLRKVKVFSLFIVSIFFVVTYVYYGLINGGFPHFAIEWIHEKYITRNDAVFEFKNVCIQSVYDIGNEHNALFYSYLTTWDYSDDIIEIEHFDKFVQHFGKYTIKRCGQYDDRNFNGAAFLSTISCNHPRQFYFFFVS